MPLATGVVLNNRYRIVKLIAPVGFGAIYRAWDISLNRACALKENLETTPEAQRHFSLTSSSSAATVTTASSRRSTVSV